MQGLRLAFDVVYTPNDADYEDGWRIRHHLQEEGGNKVGAVIVKPLGPLPDSAPPWQPYLGYLLPARFEVQVELGEDQHDLRLCFQWLDRPDLGLVAGPYLHELRVFGYQRPRTPSRVKYRLGMDVVPMPVTSTSLRRVRVAPVERLAVLAAVHVQEGDTPRPLEGRDEWGRFFDREWDAPQRRQGKRLPHKHYELVAEVYRDAKAKGLPPRQAVQRELHGATQSAADWIREARNRGLLEDTKER